MSSHSGDRRLRLQTAICLYLLLYVLIDPFTSSLVSLFYVLMSLCFNKYTDDDDEVVCLLKHKAIQAFPSEQFYDSQLRIGYKQQASPSTLPFWPRGRDEPIMFVNVVGVEKSLTVTTADGSEQSKSNDQEASLAVSNNTQTCSLALLNVCFFSFTCSACLIVC